MYIVTLPSFMITYLNSAFWGTQVSFPEILAVQSCQNWPLVNLYSSPSKLDSQLSSQMSMRPFHVNRITTWQCWRYFSTEHHYYLTTYRNHKAWSYPLVSPIEDYCKHQLDLLTYALERSHVPIILHFSSSFIHSFIIILFFLNQWFFRV